MDDKSAPKLIVAVKEHQGWLIVFGALLLIGTFILKEDVGDNLRDFRDSIAQAENSFRSRTEFMALRSKMETLDGEIEKLIKAEEDSRITKKRKQLAPASAPATMGEHERRLKSEELGFYFIEMRMPLDDEIANIEDILEKVKLPAEEEQRWGQDKQYLEELTRNALNIDALKLSPEEQRWKQIEMNIGVGVIQDHIHQLTPTIVRAAQEQQRRMDRRYTVVRAINFGCFLVGLVLAVIGKWYDLKILGG